MSEFQAVTCYWNPCGYTRMKTNVQRFVQRFTACPLTIVEMSMCDTFEFDEGTHGNVTVIRVHGAPNNWMWQKERLLNIAIDSLPKSVKYVGWIDADLDFVDPNWVHAATKSLEDANSVIQLFERVQFLDPSFRVSHAQPSAVSADKSMKSVAPGMAWAARREMFPLIDTHILGGGDNLMWQAFRDNWNNKDGWWRRCMSLPWVRSYEREAQELRARMGDRALGYIPGDVIHYWHGTKSNRKYVERWNILLMYGFDPLTDITLGENGLWEWSTDKLEMHEEIVEYFKGRKEDG